MPSIEQVIGGKYTAYIPDDDQAIALGYTHVRIYWGSTEEGPYALATSIALVSGQGDYTYNNTAALATDWAYHTLYGATPGESPASEPVPIGPPRSTRKLIRQGVGRKLRRMELFNIASAASATAFTITEAIDPDASSARYSNWAARLASGSLAGEVRRIRNVTNNGYVPATGVFTLGRGFSGTPATGDDVELWRPHGDEDTSALVDEAINNARFNILWAVPYVITIDADVTEYQMPDGCSEHTIQTVEYAVNRDGYPDKPQWTRLQSWDINGRVLSVFRNSRTFYPALFSAGDLVRVNYVAFGDLLESDADYWECNLQWAVAESALAFLDLLGKPEAKEEAIQHERIRSNILREAMMLRTAHMPQTRLKVLDPR